MIGPDIREAVEAALTEHIGGQIPGVLWTLTPATDAIMAILAPQATNSEVERLRGLAAWAAKELSEWDEYQKRPESGDWGVECACCMGEMFDAEDREKIAQLAALAHQGVEKP